MRRDVITEEGQFEMPDETVANAKDGEVVEDSFDAPVSPIFLKDGGCEAWGIWRDDKLEGIFAIRDLCRGGCGRLFPEDECLVNDNTGGDDIDATQSRLVASDSHCESFGCERFNILFVFDLCDWMRVSKRENKNVKGKTDSLGLYKG